MKSIKSIKKLILVMLILLAAVTLVGCSEKKVSNDVFNIGIIVYDKNQNVVYEKEETVNIENLLEALESIDDLKIEKEESQYGAFITSINGIKQEDPYYWNYYVNGDYATVGISSYKINDNDKFEFRLEKFEGGE